MTTTMEATSHQSQGHGILAPLVHRFDRQGDGPMFLRDASFIEHQLWLGRAFTSYFTPEVRGLENVPKKGPVLVVGNHNAVFWMPDVWVTGLAITERRGIESPLYSLTYDFLLSLPGLAPYLRRLGAIRADPEEADAALDQGAAVIVYPGGDWEACRPWRDRDRIDFGGHDGFVRLALRHRVPLVPVVAQGSHESVMVVWRGERIAKAIGLNALRIKVFPIMLGPSGLTTMMAPPPPLPSSVAVEFLEPMEWPELGPGDADDPKAVERCADEVTEAMEATLEELASERPHPVVKGVDALMRRSLEMALHH